MKKIIPYLLILAVITLLLTNCEKEEFNESTVNNQQERSKVNIKRVDLAYLQQKEKLNKKIQKIVNALDVTKKNNQKSSITTNDGSFTILTNEILEVTTDSTETYTFRIETPTDGASSFENFVIEKIKDDYSYWIYRFIELTEDGVDYSYSVNRQPVDENQINLGDFSNILKWLYISEGCIYYANSTGMAYIDGASVVCPGSGYDDEDNDQSGGGTTSGGYTGGNGETDNTGNPPNNNSGSGGGGGSSSGTDTSDPILNSPVGVLTDIDLEEDLPCKTSKEYLKKVFPDASDEILTKLAGILNKFGKDFGIDNKEKLQHFLAQAGHETGDFDFIAGEESLYYTSSTRLLTIYGKYFSNTDTINKRKPDNYLRNSSKVADYVYCCRMGNGDEASGDGYKYRGRGVFQLTGKNNYTNFKTFYNEKYDPDRDFITDPGLLKTNDTVAVISALWFYKKNVLDKITIDSITSVKKITKKINGGTNGLKDRKKIFNKAKDSINCN